MKAPAPQDPKVAKGRVHSLMKPLVETAELAVPVIPPAIISRSILHLLHVAR